MYATIGEKITLKDRNLIPINKHTERDYSNYFLENTNNVSVSQNDQLEKINVFTTPK